MTFAYFFVVALVGLLIKETVQKWRKHYHKLLAEHEALIKRNRELAEFIGDDDSIVGLLEESRAPIAQRLLEVARKPAWEIDSNAYTPLLVRWELVLTDLKTETTESGKLECLVAWDNVMKFTPTQAVEILNMFTKPANRRKARKILLRVKV